MWLCHVYHLQCDVTSVAKLRSGEVWGGRTMAGVGDSSTFSSVTSAVISSISTSSDSVSAGAIVSTAGGTTKLDLKTERVALRNLKKQTKDQSKVIKSHLSAVSVSGFCGTGEGSDAVTLALSGAPGHLLGINIYGWNRRDTQRMRKTPKWNMNSSKETQTESATAVNEEALHLEFSPQEKLTLRWGSVQMEPLVQDQLRLREHLSDRNHQRTNGQGPAVGELEKHSVQWKQRNVYKSKDYRFCHHVAENFYWQCSQHTLTRSISTLGSWTRKQNASFHWGAVVRSHTFRNSDRQFYHQVSCHSMNEVNGCQDGDLTVVLRDISPSVTSAPTLGSLPLFLSFAHTNT